MSATTVCIANVTSYVLFVLFVWPLAREFPVFELEGKGFVAVWTVIIKNNTKPQYTKF